MSFGSQAPTASHDWFNSATQKVKNSRPASGPHAEDIAARFRAGGSKLYLGVLNPAGVWAFDGQRWTPLGNPQGSEDRCHQVHSLEVFRGRLHVTTWPRGHFMRLEPANRWVDCGRLGDALEINAH